MDTIKRIVLLALILGSLPTFAQLSLDMGVGVSNQDQIATQWTVRQTISDNFRVGLQLQYGRANYRFVEAKAFQDEGYSTAISFPITWKWNETEHLTLSAFINPGIRIQGIIDPDGNDQRDSTFQSIAWSFEPGLLMYIPLTETWGMHTGVTFPRVHEFDPSSVFENQSTLIHAGVARTSGNVSVFMKTNWGAAWGASGDSQKFMWSGIAGLRYHFGGVDARIPHLESAL